MSRIITESEIEAFALEILHDHNAYTVLSAADLLEDPSQDRDPGEVILAARLRAATDRLNPRIPQPAREEAYRKVQRIASTSLIESNESFHRLLTEGIDVRFSVGEGRSRSDKVWLVDFDHPEANEFLAVNQFTVVENNVNKRADIVLFINGLPLVVLELKNPAAESADIAAAYNQIQTYKQYIPSLFVYNALVVISDGWFARAGTISSDFNRFMEWKSADGIRVVDPQRESELEPLILGLLNQRTLLDIIRHFIVFEKSSSAAFADYAGPLIKKVAAYHQYYAVNRAVASTLRAAVIPSRHFVAEHPSAYNLPSTDRQIPGDQRAGVIWHTQGSGKSLSMVFYTGKLVLASEMNNPTVVVLTDRNDLDDQLFQTFTACRDLLRQTPVQAASREELMRLLSVASGGIIFTTVQKFFPEEKGAVYPLLTDRRNVIVIADEAHRSQYDFIDGYARHMRDALPNATFIGFTGTPIEKDDRNTRAIFGDYIDVYDIQQAVEDGATVPIYYESRLARIELSPQDQSILDQRVEEVTEGDELTQRQQRFARWSSKESIVGSQSRIRQIAADLVSHFEQRMGKAMVVCMSRRICVELYDEIVRLRPAWHDPADDRGVLKVVMTGSSSDPLPWQEHIRNREKRKAVSDRLKDPTDPLRMLIVRDMYLTGFDAPCLQTMYIDKPMNGHTLMQAIARVNRVFGDKEGGLIVDYIGIAQELKEAMLTYTENHGKGQLAYDIEEAVSRMLEQYEIVVQLFHGFDFRIFHSLPPREKMDFPIAAAEHIAGLTQEIDGRRVPNGKQRFLDHVIRLQKAFGLAVPHPSALAIRDDLAFFQAVKARFTKFDDHARTRTNEEIETAIRQIVNDAIISHEVIDVFDAAGIKKPDVSILSEEFLAEIRAMQHPNLAIELLKRLLGDEIKTRAQTNLVQGKKFSVMLADAVRRYQNGLIDSARFFEEIFNLAREIRAADRRGEDLGLCPDELAFYDALAANPSVEGVMQDKVLKEIALELLDSVRKNATIDWQYKHSVRSRLRVMVKRILRKYHYPPDDPSTGEYTVSVDRVLSQAELLADYWSS